MSKNHDIDIESDEKSHNFYTSWEPIVISSGKTKEEALGDLREAAHVGVDNLIDLKLKDIREGDDIDG